MFTTIIGLLAMALIVFMYVKVFPVFFSSHFKDEFQK